MERGPLLYIGEEQVRERLEPTALVAGLERAFGAEFAEYLMPPRTFIEMGGHGLALMMPCYHAGRNRLGMKIATVASAGSAAGVQAAYQLIDPQTGRPLVVMAASHLTAMRTAAASAVATKYMARDDSTVLGVFGTGRLARAHLEVLRAARLAPDSADSSPQSLTQRPFTRFLVCGRTPERSAEFASAMTAELGFSVQAASARELAEQSDVICTCTNQKTPLFEGIWLRPGTHLNLTGIFRATEQEVDCDTVARSRVVVDLRDGWEQECGDIVVPIRQGRIGPEHVLGELHDVVSGKVQPRRSASAGEDITLFKSVGVALEDMVAAELVVGQACRPEAIKT